MVVLELDVSAELRPDVFRGEQPVLDDLGVEAHLVAGDGVDEGVDQLVECIEHPGDVDDQGTSEAFWIVGLEDVQNLEALSEKKRGRQMVGQDAPGGTERMKGFWLPSDHSLSSMLMTW